MTTVINVITWNNAYAIFPYSTFVCHKGYLLTNSAEYLDPLMKKYEERGWDLQFILGSETEMARYSTQSTRRVGDCYTWTIPFDTRGIKRSRTPDSVIEYSVFYIDYVSRPPSTLSAHCEIAASGFDTPALRYQYSCETFSATGRDWMTTLENRTDLWVLLEVLKLEPNARPPSFRHLISPDTDRTWVRELLVNFKQPPSWTFCDDFVPQWYKAWEDTCGTDPNR